MQKKENGGASFDDAYRGPFNSTVGVYGSEDWQCRVDSLE